MIRFLIVTMMALFLVVPTTSKASLDSCIYDYCGKWDSGACIARALRLRCGSTDINNCPEHRMWRVKDDIEKCKAQENQCVNWCKDEVKKGRQ